VIFLDHRQSKMSGRGGVSYLHWREFRKRSMASSKLNGSDTKAPNISLIIISRLFHNLGSHPARLKENANLVKKRFESKSQQKMSCNGPTPARVNNKLFLSPNYNFLMSVITLIHNVYEGGQSVQKQKDAYRANKCLSKTTFAILDQRAGYTKVCK